MLGQLGGGNRRVKVVVRRYWSDTFTAVWPTLEGPGARCLRINTAANNAAMSSRRCSLSLITRRPSAQHVAHDQRRTSPRCSDRSGLASRVRASTRTMLVARARRAVRVRSPKATTRQRVTLPPRATHPRATRPQKATRPRATHRQKATRRPRAVLPPRQTDRPALPERSALSPTAELSRSGPLPALSPPRQRCLSPRREPPHQRPPR